MAYFPSLLFSLLMFFHGSAFGASGLTLTGPSDTMWRTCTAITLARTSFSTGPVYLSGWDSKVQLFQNADCTTPQPTMVYPTAPLTFYVMATIGGPGFAAYNETITANDPAIGSASLTLTIKMPYLTSSNPSAFLGGCTPLTITRVGPQPIPSSTTTLTWTQTADFSVYYDPACTKGVSAPAPVSFLSSETAKTIYLRATAPVSTLPRTLSLTASDTLFGNASLPFTIIKPYLSFSGDTTAVAGFCSPLTIVRNGPSPLPPGTINLGGITSQLQLFADSQCRTSMSSAIPFTGETSKTIYVVGAPSPAPLPAKLSLTATDPMNFFTTGTQDFTLVSGALVLGGATSAAVGQCAAITVTRKSVTSPYDSFVLSGLSAQLQGYMDAACMNPIPSGVALSFAGAPTFTLYLRATLSPAPLPFTQTLTATDPKGVLLPASSPFTVLGGPWIGSISPAQGGYGQLVNISGGNFSATTSVKFNGVTATFSILSSGLITASVPNGATTGAISVTTPTGTAMSPSPFQVIPPPTISGVSPLKVGIGQYVDILGTNFGYVTGVTIGGVKASYYLVTTGFIRATVPTTGISGLVSVTSPIGAATSKDTVTIVPPPSITTVSPPQGAPGDSITLQGSGLADVTKVTFNGISATFIVASGVSLIASVPPGATSGPIVVTTPYGAASSSAFTVLQPIGISPLQGASGQTITLTGAGLDSAIGVAFNGINGLFKINSSTNISATVPASATSGRVTVTLSGGINLVSTVDFVVNPLCAAVIVPQKELVITDLTVVNDARTLYSATNPGHWSFGFLVGKLAGETNFASPVITSNFVKQWLGQFATVASIANGNPVTTRPGVNTFLSAWPRMADGTTLDFTKAPFRLLAITNRIDLQNAAQAGEGRFVWGVLDPATGNTLQWTVIFEYGLPLTSTMTMGQWAKRWHDLGALPFKTLGDDSYNAALEKVTDLFTATTYQNLGFARDIPLNQLRTNEFALAAPWELREFRVDATSGQMKQVSVKNNPDISFSTDPTKSSELANFLATKDPAAALPEALPSGHALLAGAAPVPNNDLKFKWFSGSTDPLLRQFSKNTCNGCHSGETGTAFVHLTLRTASTPSSPSPFLSADTQTNRVPVLQGTLAANFCQ